MVTQSITTIGSFLLGPMLVFPGLGQESDEPMVSLEWLEIW